MILALWEVETAIYLPPIILHMSYKFSPDCKGPRKFNSDLPFPVLSNMLTILPFVHWKSSKLNSVAQHCSQLPCAIRQSLRSSPAQTASSYFPPSIYQTKAFIKKQHFKQTKAMIFLWIGCDFIQQLRKTINSTE